MRVSAGARARLGVAALAVALAVASAPARASGPAPRTPASVAVAWTTRAPDATQRSASLPPARPQLTPAQAVAIVLATARAQIGKPYKWGAVGPKAFDCSGLTRFAWAAAGVKIPRVSRWQYRRFHHVGVQDLRPGDLVFFGRPRIHHVGIYLGGGKMIDAPYKGARVRVEPLLKSYAGAARPPVS